MTKIKNGNCISNKEEQTRCKKLRVDVIEFIKKLVVEKPDEYDSNKLQEAIDKINSVSDDNIDAFLIMNKHLNIIQKPIYMFTDDEKAKIDALKTKLGITQVETEKYSTDEPERCDYMARWYFNGESYVIWFNKSRPFIKSGLYNLLGINLWFPCINYNNIDDLLNKLESKLKEN